MSETLPITEARAKSGTLVELADLEDALALAEYRARQAAGEVTGVPHAEVRVRLGLERTAH
ncbi:type II toxin-antitoxin system prevent-host-death family antitoxin [Streptomyces sp. MZ04]|uniref:type II toxin-antitoxin system prevent-host-death family antitoxin n=1 Tax=Streptomyces sp. MZ04 TaxID=2559236 RepID=UPI00107E970E|nr:type II toxin-antitoxin system prevent-host-death family antitoxin [Streptomyces sp. MZ04]TGA91167.1 type II toxin-antitoxin system prevent-host-death family antitoxin [Streptomyces sp. MZ04]